MLIQLFGWVGPLLKLHLYSERHPNSAVVYREVDISAHKICSRISLFIVVAGDPHSSLAVGDSQVRSHQIYIWLPMKDVIPSGMLYMYMYVHITTGELV